MMTAEKYYSELKKDKDKRYEDEMYISLGKKNSSYSKAIPEEAYKRIACYILNGYYQGLLIDACDEFKTRVEKAKKFFILPSEDNNTDDKNEEEKTTSEETKKETYKESHKNNNTKDDKKNEEKKTTSKETKKETYKEKKKMISESTDEIKQDKFIFDPDDPNIIDGEYREISDENTSNPSDAINFNVKSQFIPDEEDKPKRKEAIFNYDKMNTALNSEIPKKKINKTLEKKLKTINDYLKDLIPKGLTMSINPMITGMIELSLSQMGKSIAIFNIDPNIIHGNGNYLIGTSEIGIVAIPFQESELIRKCLSGYTLTKEDVDVCRKYIFNNSNIYKYIDMSGDKLKDISDIEYKSLELQLSNILTSLKAKNILGRYRILSYKDDMNFVLKSDNFVKCYGDCVMNTTGYTITVNINEVIITDANKNIIESFKMVMQ